MTTVTVGAIVKRTNRKLVDRRLVRARGERDRAAFGAFYVVSGRPGHIYVHTREVDPEAFARELGVMHAAETVVES